MPSIRFRLFLAFSGIFGTLCVSLSVALAQPSQPIQSPQPAQSIQPPAHEKAVSPGVAETVVVGGEYVSRDEFEAFLKQYREDRAEEQAANVLAASGILPPSPSLGKCMAWKKGPFTFTPYGYFNLSAAYETSKSSVGDFCIYPLSPDIDGNDVFYIDPRSTRVGMKVDGPGIKGWHGSRSRGTVEIDFQGSYTIRNRGSVLLRKAFIEVYDKDLKFLAGQDWEIISPLYPATLNYTAGAAVGNVGYRRAQLRFDRNLRFSHHTNLLIQFGIVDNVLRDGLNAPGLVQPNVGDWPVVQGRLAYAFGGNLFAHGKPITFGVSAHIGEQQFDFTDIGIRSNRKYRTWSLNLDADIPLAPRWKIQGELFVGENLGSFEGGILQGVDLVRRETVRAQGGWVDLEFAYSKKLKFNGCFLIDDPFNQDLLGGSATDGRSRNYSHSFFVNALYNWTDFLMTGFEVSFWRTHWQQYDSQTRTATPLRAAEMVRYEFVTRYTF